MDLLETPAMIVRPKMPSQNFSADMNFSASCASSGEKKYSEMQLSRPPQKELQQAVASALPARPCSVIWYPSIAVAADAGVPGVWMRMAEIDPPKMAPQ